jgi:hypothetical protein
VWHVRLLATMPAIRLTLLVVDWAQRHLLVTRASAAVTVEGWREHLPCVFPLPHPSWRNRAWVARHPRFEAEALPACVSCEGAGCAGGRDRSVTRRGQAGRPVSWPAAPSAAQVSADFAWCTAASP